MKDGSNGAVPQGSEPGEVEETSLAGTSGFSVHDVSKSFGRTRALTDFSCEVKQGEIHALIGGNGSGKSTLIKIIAGVVAADVGRLEVAGGAGTYDLTQFSPTEAREVGLRFVHQDLGLFSSLSVAENLAIGSGFPLRAGGWIDGRRLRSRATGILETFNLSVDPRWSVSRLSPPQRAILAIARALDGDRMGGGATLVLDEPTASLGPKDATFLLEFLHDLAAKGHAVVLVTHRLDEVRAAADHVTAIRDGVKVETVDAQSLDEAEMAVLMFGRRLSAAVKVERALSATAPVLEARGLAGGPLADVDLTVRPGEVLGVAGLMGSGRTELLGLLTGSVPITSGWVRLDGEELQAPSPRRTAERGMVLVPEDRAAEGTFGPRVIYENMTVGHTEGYFRRLWLRDKDLEKAVDADIAEFMIKARSGEMVIATLSGGNQQKVVLARCLRQRPKVLLLDEPTQGIDVSAREDIYGLIDKATAAGAAVVLVSSEFSEIARLAQRSLILCQGRVTETIDQPMDSHDILAAVLRGAQRMEH